MLQQAFPVNMLPLDDYNCAGHPSQRAGATRMFDQYGRHVASNDGFTELRLFDRRGSFPEPQRELLAAPRPDVLCLISIS